MEAACSGFSVLLFRYGSLECVKVLTSYGANVSHRDEDGMSVLEHAEQNDRRQVVGLIKRAQLANQMRQRRKHKHQNKENGMTQEEFEERNVRAREQMDELLQEIEQEAEGAEARRARQRARRTARKNERRSARRRDNVSAYSRRTMQAMYHRDGYATATCLTWRSGRCAGK